MTFPTYRRAVNPQGVVSTDALGEVVNWQVRPGVVGVAMRCPCGERLMAASPEKHVIEFDGAGLLTLDPSCGYAADNEHPENWCHFWLKGGQVKMVSDAKCPGGTGEVQP